MLHKRIMDIPGWGEGTAGAFKPGETFAGTLDNVIIERAIVGPKGYVSVAGKFNGRTTFSNLGPLNEETFPKVMKIVDDNRGKPLLSIGPIEIPNDVA